MEGAAHIVPSSGIYHYVVRAQAPFTGYLQHLVNNTKVGVITTCGGCATTNSSGSKRRGGAMAKPDVGAVSGSTTTIKTMADGTLRVSVDIEPRHAQTAFTLFGAPGTPVALARCAAA